MIHIIIEEEIGIRHEYWEPEQYYRQPEAKGRHAYYVCYTFKEEE